MNNYISNMGLLKRLKPSKPNLSTKPVTIFYATIGTDGGTHPFVYLIDPQKDRPVFLYNEREFRMPVEPMFMETDSVGVEYGDRVVPVKLIEAADTESWPGDDQIRVDIPDVFRGAWIPARDELPDELEQLS